MKQVDWDKPLQTRDGRKVRVLCTNFNDPGSSKSVIVAARSDKRRGEIIIKVHSNGSSSYNREYTGELRSDIINVSEIPPKFSDWFNRNYDPGIPGVAGISLIECYTNAVSEYMDTFFKPKND